MSRRAGRTLGDVGEHAWIGRMSPMLERHAALGRVIVGPGDDAAIVRPGTKPIVITTDALVDGVHFQRAAVDPRALGRRAYRAAASDVGAMGGRPIATVLALTAPRTMDATALGRVTAGVATEASADRAPLVGGNVTRGGTLTITVTVLGEVPGPIVQRGGARAGDALLVTGPLGAAAAALDASRGGARVRWPPVPNRIALGVALAKYVHAMIDLSDGLVQDLEHLCRASAVGAELEVDDVPVAPRCRRHFGDDALGVAITGGEDYELLAAASPRRLPSIRRAAARRGVTISVVGRIVSRPRRVVLRGGGPRLRPSAAGFDHFS